MFEAVCPPPPPPHKKKKKKKKERGGGWRSHPPSPHPLRTGLSITTHFLFCLNLLFMFFVQTSIIVTYRLVLLFFIPLLFFFRSLPHCLGKIELRNCGHSWVTAYICLLNSFIPADQCRCFCKQCRSRWDGSLRAVSSGSTLFPILWLICDWTLYLWQMDVFKFRGGSVHFRNSGVKGYERLHLFLSVF